MMKKDIETALNMLVGFSGQGPPLIFQNILGIFLGSKPKNIKNIETQWKVFLQKNEFVC